MKHAKNKTIAFSAILVMCITAFAGISFVSDHSSGATPGSIEAPLVGYTGTNGYVTCPSEDTTVYIYNGTYVDFEFVGNDGWVVDSIEYRGFVGGAWQSWTTLSQNSGDVTINGLTITYDGHVYGYINGYVDVQANSLLEDDETANDTTVVHLYGRNLQVDDTAEVGSYYSKTLTHEFISDLVWAGVNAGSGELPPGLSVTYAGSDYTVSGTPTTAGTYYFTIGCEGYSIEQGEDVEDYTYYRIVVTDTSSYSHTVTYDANGGTGTMSDTVVTDAVSGNTDVTLAPNGFTYTGYNFVGWSVNDVIYQPNATVPVAGNSTVTAIAQWEEGITHTITYLPNGGSGSMSDTVVTDSNTGSTNITLAPNGFTYTGYNFVGWQVNGIIQQPGSTVAVAGGSTVTATAQWEVIYTHTVTYDANGGTGTMEDTVVSDNISGDTNVTLASNGFTYTGRTFTGWKIGTTIYQPGESVAVAGNGTANAIAQWTVSYTHTITYLANGGTGTMSDTVVTDNVSGSTNVALANCTYTRTGYTFTGWLVSGILRQVGDEIPVNGNATVSATAQWSQNTLTASVNNIIGYSEGVYSNQISATASTGGVLSYGIASVTGGTATVNASGLVTYTAPQVNASQVYTIAITVTATFPSTETVVRTISFTASIDPTPIGVTVNTGIAQKEVDQTPEGYYVDDVNFNGMDVTVYIGPQYTETETNNIMDDTPQIRTLVGIIPILMLAGIVAYVSRSMKTSRR